MQKKIFSILVMVVLSFVALHAYVYVPVSKHTHYGEIVFVESYYSDDSVYVGSEQDFAKNGYVNSITNVKYEQLNEKEYSNEPVYYRFVESLYKYNGCGHTFTSKRIEIINEKLSDYDLQKWERLLNKKWIQKYDWEHDEYTVDNVKMLFLIFLMFVLSGTLGAIVGILADIHKKL